ncbi:cobalt ECF transporter T component CbiQ [Oceanobacillus limi]|uniref:Cobalt ECF transporter T component CbiQ n=1 Tax=Oceanobacillus limi TaxID=930131 RepID=A0A1I0FD38_9BACI|nr:cobalt ECF transporter T component CbiQ [Oceanobacillus limi]SET55431.1 cobalt ECF transporter T component CbiQ [Oceanobacillus limi]
MEETVYDQQQTQIPKWARSWESRSKLIAAICYIFGVISLTTLPTLIIAYTFSLITLVSMRISFILLLKRYLIITPFLLLMTLPLFSQYTMDNALFASLIIIKAFTSMTVITILLETQSLDTLMNSLTGLKMPPMLITILILSYRYVFLFLDDISRMMTAAKSRFFKGELGVRSLRVYGHFIASLLIKALHRSDKMYEAMASRGFNGQLAFQSTKKVGYHDIFKTCLTVIVIALLIIFERTS